MSANAITTTSLLAEATSVLLESGYTRDEASEIEWPGSIGRVFEDAYGIVSLLAFDTWEEMRDSWPVAQGRLVELISGSVNKGEPKAWEGYLVLLTSSSAGAESSVVSQIRYDVTRVRKLVATGDDLLGMSDVRRVLLPLLHLEPSFTASTPSSAVELIPSLLTDRGIPPSVGVSLVDAYQRQEPLMEQLHSARKAL